MSWNEPDDKNQNDPRNSSGNRGPNGNPQPPDLDKILLELHNKFKRAMRNGRGGGDIPPFQPPRFTFSTMPFKIIGMIVLFLYLCVGIYIVGPGEQAVVFQFGRYVKSVGPGPHWIPPLIRSKTVVDVQQVRSSAHRNRMLTGDENIVEIEAVVQWRIDNLPNYLFNLVNPQYTLAEATDSAIRQVVGSTPLDQLITSERASRRDEIARILKETLELYHAGIYVTSVEMGVASYPEEVKDAFDDAIKAREDQDRTINEAETYRERVVPVAKGRAQRVSAEARAYAAEKALIAQGDIDRFNLIVDEYKKAPGVTRRRMYIETLESVLGDMNKILVDSKAGNNMLYLPLEELMKQRLSASNNMNSVSFGTDKMPAAPLAPPAIGSLRHDDFSNTTRAPR